MTSLEKRVLGKYDISINTIKLMHMKISSLQDDIIFACNDYYNSKKQNNDVENYERCIRVILYQKAIAKARIEIIKKELKINDIEVDYFQFGG